MIRASAALLALGLMAAPLHASDERLLEVRYDESRVYRVEGKPKVQATIRFGEDETIENVAIGDSNAWQVTPNKRANLLFVKPLLAKVSTNMTVVTDKRTYLFDLVASPGAQPLYVLSFTYPDAPKPNAEVPTQFAEQSAGPPEPVTDPALLNFAWEKSGDKKLLPENVFDDGETFSHIGDLRCNNHALFSKIVPRCINYVANINFPGVDDFGRNDSRMRRNIKSHLIKLDVALNRILHH